MKSLTGFAITLFIAVAIISTAGGQQYAYRTPKDVLVYGALGDPRDLDPAKAYDTGSSLIIDNVYEKLVGYEVVDGKWTPKIVPVLAESWNVSDDGKVYTFKLRRNVTFHDGTKFNASAVKYSLDRAKRLNLGPYGPVLGVAYDSSRFVVGYGLFGSPTSENALKVLDEAVLRYGKPDSILTDRGSQFYASAIVKEKGLTVFEEHLNELGIKHIVGRVNHPQTNGKIERFYGTVKDKIDEFSSMDELIVWYNSIRPHMSHNTEILETPEEAFYRKLDRGGNHGK